MANKKAMHFNMWTISSDELKAHSKDTSLSADARQKLEKLTKEEYSLTQEQIDKINSFARASKAALMGRSRRKASV